MRKCIGNSNTLTLNGRIYTKDVLEGVAKDINNRKNKVFCYASPDTTIETITGVIKFAEVVDDKLMVDIDLLEVPAGKHLKCILKRIGDDSLNCYPSGYGCVGKDGVVSDYELENVVMCFDKEG